MNNHHPDLHPKWIEAVERNRKDPTNDDWMFIVPTTGEPEMNWKPPSVWDNMIKKIKEIYNSYFNIR